MKRIAIILGVLVITGVTASTAKAGGHGHGHGGHGHSGHVHGSYGGGFGGVGYGGGFGFGGGRSFRAPIYHGPSVHYDRVYHADRLHWTPGRGLHTHGHYDLVPHYVPGHFDTLHRNHIHGNPWYHH